MAMPIAPTPVLDSLAAQKFLKKITSGLSSPVKVVPTPRVDSVISRIMADASKRKK